MATLVAGQRLGFGHVACVYSSDSAASSNQESLPAKPLSGLNVSFEGCECELDRTNALG